MMVATFNGERSPTIISCYSPTNAIDEKDLDTFYDEFPPFFVASRNTTF